MYREKEWNLLEKGLNRVTDTCIPEEEAFRRLQQHIYKIWQEAEASGERYFPHEFMYKLLLSGVLEDYYEIDIKDSWMYAAAQKDLPMVVPGWEDSTMGNIFASYVFFEVFCSFYAANDYTTLKKNNGCHIFL